MAPTDSSDIMGSKSDICEKAIDFVVSLFSDYVSVASILSKIEIHVVLAARLNKNVYCFSSTTTRFLLFPSSSIITFLLFSSPATRFLLFSFYHRNSSIVFLHHHYHHNSTVFPPPPPQFCCFPRPHHMHIYCFPAKVTRMVNRNCTERSLLWSRDSIRRRRTSAAPTPGRAPTIR